ncbi:MAG: hypothetical protein U1F01_01140 [Acinetobacter sp.]
MLGATHSEVISLTGIYHNLLRSGVIYSMFLLKMNEASSCHKKQIAAPLAQSQRIYKQLPTKNRHHDI